MYLQQEGELYTYYKPNKTLFSVARSEISPKINYNKIKTNCLLLKNALYEKYKDYNDYKLANICF